MAGNALCPSALRPPSVSIKDQLTDHNTQHRRGKHIAGKMDIEIQPRKGDERRERDGRIAEAAVRFRQNRRADVRGQVPPLSDSHTRPPRDQDQSALFFHPPPMNDALLTLWRRGAQGMRDTPSVGHAMPPSAQTPCRKPPPADARMRADRACSPPRRVRSRRCRALLCHDVDAAHEVGKRRRDHEREDRDIAPG